MFTAFAAFAAFVLIIQLLTGDESWLAHLGRLLNK